MRETCEFSGRREKSPKNLGFINFRRSQHFLLAPAFLLLFFCLGCNNINNKKDSDEKWVSLIKQNSLEGWHYYQDDGKKSGWEIDDGVLTFTSEKAFGEGDKSLVSDKEYTNFKIHLEWKVSPGSNSGFI